MDARAALAARNNAEWCDLVCRTHGVAGQFDEDAWVSPRRTPPLYPDAVSLSARATPGVLLDRVDRSPGCSIKDSFASLDLSTDGFRMLFEAEWIHRAPAGQSASVPLRWSLVRTPDELRAWSAAHGAGDLFRPALLDDPTVAILAAHADGTIAGGTIAESAIAAGVIANRSAAVVGVSNLFTAAGTGDAWEPGDVWAGAVAAITARFPGAPLVGYESGDSLAAAHRAGFTSTGPLRIWWRE
jgi:hypothetical protein